MFAHTHACIGVGRNPEQPRSLQTTLGINMRINDDEEANQHGLKRMTSPERFELAQLRAAGVVIKGAAVEEEEDTTAPAEEGIIVFACADWSTVLLHF